MIQAPFAYLGPGVGFAFLGSFLSLLLSLAAGFVSLLLWPFRALWGMVRRSRGIRAARVKKLIFLGLDGLDPESTEKLMVEGKLPSLRRLKEQGSYRRLRTTAPAPTVWSTFATGVHSAAPEPFWRILGRNAVDSTILRVPVPFPMDDFDGRLLSAGASPDLPGMQTGFSWFTKKGESGAFKGGKRYPLLEADGVLVGKLAGPGDAILFRVHNAEHDPRLEIDGESYPLKRREFTPWIRLKFGIVHGIVRFLATKTGQQFSLYATAVQIDPERPAVPISHPRYYANYLAKLLGSFSTTGMANDASALNAGVIDQEDFLTLAKLIQHERETIFFSALDHQRTGVLACVFDTSDRVPDVLYCDMDRLVGRTLEHADADTIVFVLSDHGVLFSNRNLDAKDPGIEDMAPTALRLFGIRPPEWMEGKSVISLA